MKKLLVVLIFGVFAACSSGITSTTGQDSAFSNSDSAKNNSKAVVDSAANAQKAQIDSIIKDSDEDSTAKKTKDSTKK